MEKQTAVEWLEDEVDRIIETYDVDMMRYPLEKAYNQAKEIEKEHHEKTFNESRLTHPLIGFKHQSFNEYYNETFKSE